MGSVVNRLVLDHPAGEVDRYGAGIGDDHDFLVEVVEVGAGWVPRQPGHLDLGGGSRSAGIGCPHPDLGFHRGHLGRLQLVGVGRVGWIPSCDGVSICDEQFVDHRLVDPQVAQQPVEHVPVGHIGGEPNGTTFDEVVECSGGFGGETATLSIRSSWLDHH
jgi:hypothetical protein